MTTNTQQLLDAVLGTVVPAAQNLIVGLLGSATGVGAAAPLVQALIAGIENLRATTQPTYPDSWAGVQSPWVQTVAQWRALNPALPINAAPQQRPLVGRPDHAGPFVVRAGGRPDH